MTQYRHYRYAYRVVEPGRWDRSRNDEPIYFRATSDERAVARVEKERKRLLENPHTEKIVNERLMRGKVLKNGRPPMWSKTETYPLRHGWFVLTKDILLPPPPTAQ